MISYLPPIRPYGVEAGVMLIGGSMVLTWWKSLRLGRASQSWPRVRGTIVSSELEGYPLQPPSTGMRMRTPAIEYEFRVNGERFTGSMIGVAGASGNAADIAVHKYRKGTEVDVSYDPADPRRAMLQPGVYHDAYAWICIGLFLLACGAGAMILTSRAGR
jgi:hypothetical protein